MVGARTVETVQANRGVLMQLSLELDLLRERMVSAATTAHELADVDPMHRASAENLLHYVALRHHDVRDLQRQLARLGLSSLGRAEAHVLATVDAVRRALSSLAERPAPEPTGEVLDVERARRLLDRNSAALLGPARGGRRTRIMVTLPSEAATDAGLVDRLVGAGAEVVRINCAHDGPAEWTAMIGNVRRAESVHGIRVVITMDLGGPKLRTGPIAAAPQVLRIRPERDALGVTVTPARVWLTTSTGPRPAGAAVVPVEDPQWLTEREVGEHIVLRDTRGSRRTMTVVDVAADGVSAELADTAYLAPGTKLAPESGRPAAVGTLPAAEQKITLRNGDELVLVPSLEPVTPTAVPPRIGCTLPQVFRDARVGHRVFFDDGKIGGVVTSTASDALRVRITEAAPRGSRLGAAKGINLSDTSLVLPALTEEDAAHLPFVVEHADAVSLSFVRDSADVEALQSRLADLGGEGLGIILKVETVSGFQNLPEILLTALRSPRVGVMIARGDLAVEAGYARLAEVQEEILWVCEAAHVPVVWATQVLDHLARTGRPSRAEVTDAAMAGRAECVMLNKGPFVDHAVAFLADVLARMGDHQRKKSPLLRQLHAWR